MAEPTEDQADGLDDDCTRARQAVCDRRQSFTINDEILVVPAPVATIGLGQTEPVQLPCCGPLHNQHAQITRSRGRYFVSPCPHPSRQPYVAVEGRPVGSSAPLGDGQQIELGDGRLAHLRFAWRFCTPLADSTTALLDVRSSPVIIRDAGETRCFNLVVLLGDTLVIRSAAPAHWVVPQLPCGQVVLRWTERGLAAEAAGGTIHLEPACEAPAVPLQLPCTLVAASPEEPGRHQILAHQIPAPAPSRSTMEFHLKLVQS